MEVNPQQLENYRQALEAWKVASKEAQKIKDRINSNATTPDNVYIITNQDLTYLNKECDLYQRLASAIRTL